MSRLYKLDGLRGFACLLVIVGHTYGTFGNSWISHQIVAAKSGVYLFFILSAFLLTGQFLEGYKSTQDKLWFLGRYFHRRVIRIIPLYFIALTAYYSVGLLVPNKSVVIQDFPEYLRNIFMYKGSSIFWTVPVEFKFYFLIPFLGIMATAKNGGYKILCIFILCILLSLIGFSGDNKGDLFSLSYVFILGCLLACIFYKSNFLEQRTRPLLNTITGAAMICAYILIPTFLIQVSGYTMGEVEYMAHIWSIIGFFLMASILGSETYITALMSNAVMRFIGKISYSIYLWHLLIFVITKVLLTDHIPTEINILVAWTLTIIVAYFSYNLIEMRLGKLIFKENQWKEKILET